MYLPKCMKNKRVTGVIHNICRNRMAINLVLSNRVYYAIYYSSSEIFHSPFITKIWSKAVKPFDKIRVQGKMRSIERTEKKLKNNKEKEDQIKCVTSSKISKSNINS